MAGSDLALVCASLGGLQADEDGNERYTKSPDCLESLRDLQRHLRRDHPETRDVFLELGKWNLVRQDLVPLIKRYSDDFDIVLNCVKTLVFLTMPVDPTSHQVAKQVEYLQHFKVAIVEGDAIAVIVSHMEEPLQNLESGCPKDDDWKIFQLFLTLLRNFLSIPDCLPQHGPSSPHISNLRDQMLERLFTESAMELVVVLTQHVAGRGKLRQDNLLILEILQHVFSCQQADLVAAAAHRDAKVAKHSETSAATLRAVLQSEREQLKKIRKGNSPFTGMFVQVARDGSKTMLTRNPHQSPLENLIRKPQVKRGHIKRIAQDPHPVFHSSDHIYVLLKDFADQFLAGGYNILMQSVKEDIRRERPSAGTVDIVAFFQVAQFFTSYQCCIAQKDQLLLPLLFADVKNHRKKLNEDYQDEVQKEAAPQKHICGLIASTMDEAMFTMVISKWHEFADSAVETKDWKPLAAAGGVMKELIRMLDLVLKRSGSLTNEGKEELRTARILLYKVFYDQTDNGLLYFLNSLIRSFDIYKQPRSHLADLVEITHIVLRILDGFAKSGESLRVLTKVRGGWKKKPKASEQPQNKATEQDATEAEAHGKAPEGDAEDPHSPRHTSVDSEGSGEERIEGNVLVFDGEARPPEQSEVEVEKNNAVSSHEEDEEDNTFHTSPADTAAGGDGDGDGDDSDGGRQNRTKEVNLNIRAAVDKFANNSVVCNYCWLLKFYSTNRAAINHYIVRMLQRICEDCMLEPMLYQLSILQTFYSVLSDEQVQAAEDHRFVFKFLSKLVRRLFKKMEVHPILFVDILSWKTRAECHNISADYMIHSLQKETGGSSQSRKRINIADALGDDEEDVPMNRDSDNEGSATSSDDDDADAPDECNLFSEDQEDQIKEMFERYKDDEQHAQLIASELELSGEYTAAQVLRKLQSLGLVEPSLKQSRKKVLSGGDKTEKGQNSPARKLNTRKTSNGSRRSSLFSEAQDQALKELFDRYGNGKNVTKVITQNLGGEFTTAQVSRRLRTLGLVKPKPRTAHDSLQADLTDSEEDDEKLPRMVTDLFSWEGNSSADKRGEEPAQKRRVNTDNLFDSDDDNDVLANGFSGVASPVRQQEKPFRKRRIESVDLIDSDDDISLTRLVRSSPIQDETVSGDPKVEGHNVVRTNAIDLEDSDDDAQNTGRIRPTLTEEGATKADHTEEKYTRRRRVTTVDSDSEGGEDDLPSRSIRSAPILNTVELEDSEDEIPTGRMTGPAPSLEGNSGLDQMEEKTLTRRDSSDALEDTEGDVPISRLTRLAPRQERNSGLDHKGEENFSTRDENAEDLEDSEDDVNQSGFTVGSTGKGHLRKRKRGNTLDLSDSEEDGL